MGLIDADALKEYIDCGHLRSPAEVCFSERDVVDLIDAQPTVDAVPVSELHEVEKERDYWMDKAQSYEQTILRLSICTGEVPIIRCKDCKHWDGDDSDTFCSELGIFGTDPNSFCSYAVRKEE
jgi:hypothetical protein